MGWDIRKADLAVGGCRRAVKTAGVYTLSSHEREGENSAPLTLGHLLWGSLPGRAEPLKGWAAWRARPPISPRWMASHERRPIAPALVEIVDDEVVGLHESHGRVSRADRGERRERRSTNTR